MLTIDFKRLNIKAGDRLLDLGCGEGRHCINAAIAHTDIQVVGVDLSHKDLTVARSRLNDFDTEFGSTARQNPMTLCLANGLQLPFNDNSFDHIICSEVLEHVPDVESEFLAGPFRCGETVTRHDLEVLVLESC
mgnify:CR=1 FL=1